MKSLGFIGGGRITSVFLQAMKNRDVNVDHIVVSDPDTIALKKLTHAYSVLNVTTGSNTEAAGQDIVFLAVHPPVLKNVLPDIAESVSRAKAVVSLAPVFTAEKISGLLNGYNKLVRMIPSAASYINAGFNPMWFSNSVDGTVKKQLLHLFDVLGECPQVEEEKLEAYAIVTAMGPTYLWPQLNELHKLALEFGMTEKETVDGIKAMLENTLQLMYDAGLSYDEVVDLIPVKPLGESEADFRNIYRTQLSGLYKKLKGNTNG
ncbi:MAG: NAD(P)-binding domain-containing protein [candidate division KSB1 bacterium]|nr:NAD(P)-binding domain-containing protein [candidate division KSB1 bacterium]